MSNMRALPDAVDADVPQVTGITCPDCFGVVEVRGEGNEANLSFVCRVGHTYDVTELLSAKEEGLDTRLWTVITAFEELAALLEDLTRLAGGRGRFPTSFEDRAIRARTAATALREIARTNRPVDLAPAQPGPLFGEASAGSGGAA
jgi:hypothetical protein